jgi:hypothetical protein
MEALIYSVVITLSVLAIICLVKFLTAMFFKKQGKLLCMFTIVPIKGNTQDIEYTIRSLLWRENWENYTGQRIILVLIDCDEETTKLCQKLCEEYEPVCICSPDEIRTLIDNPNAVL